MNSILSVPFVLPAFSLSVRRPLAINGSKTDVQHYKRNYLVCNADGRGIRNVHVRHAGKRINPGAK